MAEKLPLDLPSFLARLARVRADIGAASARGGHATQGAAPRVVVITKYLEAVDCARLRGAGIAPLGENRARDLALKFDSIAGSASEHEAWHFVGHLQSNKIADVVPRIGLLHSVDSERLAVALESELARRGGPALPCLLQVNVAREESKGGFGESAARDVVAAWQERHPHLHLCGLMTMAPLVPPEETRPCFRRLRTLRDELRTRLRADAAERFRELSMGMSNDYLVAAEEGATLLRIGSTLYHSDRT